MESNKLSCFDKAYKILDINYKSKNIENISDNDSKEIVKLAIEMSREVLGHTYYKKWAEKKAKEESMS